jgi:hypothetical protein
MVRGAVCGLLLAMLTTGAAAQLAGPGLTLRTGAEQAEPAPGFGLRGWVGGAPGALGSDGLVSSSMLVADWYPMASGFRLSGGLAYGALRLDPALSAGSYRAGLRDGAIGGIGGIGSEPRTWLTHGNPYLGLGWAMAPKPRGGVYLTADVGVMVQRGNFATWGCPGGVASGVCGEVRALEGLSALDEARIAPMMSLGVGLRF